MQEVFSRNVSVRTFLPKSPVLSWWMETNVALRIYAWRLTQLGIVQKVLAASMGMSETKFSRWLKQEGPPASVKALDGLRAFRDKLREETLFDVETLSPADQERLEAELGITKTEQTIKRVVQKKNKKSTVRNKGVAR